MTMQQSSPSTEMIETTLRELYERRTALDRLIVSLEEYDRTFVDESEDSATSQENPRLRRLAS
jgi:hypothetical protein